jgi:hypothetical protein
MSEEIKKEDTNKDQIIKETKKDEDIRTNQTKWIFIIIVIVLILVVVGFGFKKNISSIFTKDENKPFEYNGLVFGREQLGNINFYVTYTNLTIKKVTKEYKFYFRTNPKELDKIPSEMPTTIMAISYVSFSPFAAKCQNISLVSWNLGDILGRLGSVASGAMTERTNETKNDTKIVNCSTYENATTLIVQEGNETKIYQDKNNSNCYYLEAPSCEFNKVSDKFILGLVLMLRNEA